MTRTKQRKKVIRRRRVALLVILTLILLSSIAFGSKVIGKHKLKTYVQDNFSDLITVEKENKDAGKTISKIDYDNNSIKAIHYPELGKKNIDKKIKNMVDTYSSSFDQNLEGFEAEELKDMKTLHIDYDSYNYKDKINTIVFKVKEDDKDELIRTVVYNLENDENILLDNLFIDEALPYISSHAIDHFRSTESTKELMDDSSIISSLSKDFRNYSNFIIHEDTIEFLLPQISREESFKLAYEDLDMYLKYDFENLAQYPQELIEEKIKMANLGNSIRPGLDPNKPMVALTYDDGPYENVTGPILDQLKKHNGAATFFVLGEKVNSNQELLKRMVDQGSEIGNHSYSHKQLTKLSVDELMKEVNDTQNAIKNVVGFEPRLLRPTYGAINERLENNVPMPLMLWSIDTLDWKYRDADRVVNSILNNVEDGDIVLMHDLYDSTREASLRVIPELVNRGYQLVTLTEMYELKDLNLEAGERYTHIK